MGCVSARKIVPLVTIQHETIPRLHNPAFGTINSVKPALVLSFRRCGYRESVSPYTFAMALLTGSSKSSTYFSRLIVSLYLRPLVGRREIRKILQCADYRRAKVRGAAREAHLAQLFAKLRRSHSHMQPVRLMPRAALLDHDLRAVRGRTVGKTSDHG